MDPGQLLVSMTGLKIRWEDPVSGELAAFSYHCTDQDAVTFVRLHQPILKLYPSLAELCRLIPQIETTLLLNKHLSGFGVLFLTPGAPHGAPT